MKFLDCRRPVSYCSQIVYFRRALDLIFFLILQSWIEIEISTSLTRQRK